MKTDPPRGYYSNVIPEYWSYSIADLGLRIVDFKCEYYLILIPYIRNLQSEIRNPLTPSLQYSSTPALQYSNQIILHDIQLLLLAAIIIVLKENHFHFRSLIQSFGVHSDFNQPIGFYHGTD